MATQALSDGVGITLPDPMEADQLLNRLASTEAARLQSLQSTRVWGTPPEPAFDDFSSLAAEICECPAAYISFIDDTKQWIKSMMNLPGSMCEMPREEAICNTTICYGDVMMIRDLRSDDRFREAPIVKG